MLIPDAFLYRSVGKCEPVTGDTHTVGIPWTWIGVGCTMPLRSRPARMARGNFIWANDLIGGGTSSPSTNIHSFFRTRLWRASDIAKMYCGGFQLKQAVSYVRITLPQQSIFHSVKFPYNPTNQLINQPNIYPWPAIFTAACIKLTVIWGVTLCSLVDRHQTKWQKIPEGST